MKFEDCTKDALIQDMEFMCSATQISRLSDFADRYIQNNFSFWFPKVKDCGIKVPRSVIFQTPQDMYEHFYMEHQKEDMRTIQKWVDEVIEPGLKEAGLNGLLFIKNGTFSNKFDASTCLVRLEPGRLALSIAAVNYESACVDAGGETELVIRERIDYNRRKTPCIYNGLPLRPEFRVFYDFAKHQVIFSANYWDYDYVYPHLYEATDKIIFEHERQRIESEFIARKSEVEQLVKDHMESVSGLDGPWSVDIMLDEAGQYWLIDMAVAEQSAYWEFRPDNEEAFAKQKAAEAEEIEKYLIYADDKKE